MLSAATVEGPTAPLALAHKRHNLVLQERPTVQNIKKLECQSALLGVGIYEGCSFLLQLSIIRLHLYISDSPAENIDKLLTLNFL